MQYLTAAAPPGEISIWPAELASPNLPPVCVKTGQPAAGYHTLKLVPSDLWCALREAALREPAAYSADLRWHWDGAQWVSTLLAGMSKTSAASPGRRIAWWQVTAGMLIGWALLGGLGWWRFHG